MKLSEVIKAIEDGSKSEFVTLVDKLFYKIKLDKFGFVRIYMNGQSQADFPNNCEWEEVKPPRQWSEKELMLFKLLPKNIKWLARDKSSAVCCYESEPLKLSTCFAPSQLETEDSQELSLFDDFLTITFEESPVYIGDLKGE